MLIISLDTDRRLIDKRLQADTLLSVPTICDGRAFSSPLVSLLGVRHIPGILLLNAEGRIVARDIAPKNLEQSVSDLLKSPQTISTALKKVRGQPLEFSSSCPRFFFQRH